RGRLADELEKRGFAEDARRERDYVLAFGWYRYCHVGNLLNRVARQSLRDGDFARAGRCYEKSLIGCMRMSAAYVDHEAYLTAPQRAPLVRLRAALAEKKFDEALALARASLEALPDVEITNLIAAVVPALERGGRARDADEIFGATMKRFEQMA